MGTTAVSSFVLSREQRSAQPCSVRGPYHARVDPAFANPDAGARKDALVLGSSNDLEQGLQQAVTSIHPALNASTQTTDGRG